MAVPFRSDSYDFYIKIGLKYGQSLLVLVKQKTGGAINYEKGISI